MSLAEKADLSVMGRDVGYADDEEAMVWQECCSYLRWRWFLSHKIMKRRTRK